LNRKDRKGRKETLFLISDGVFLNRKDRKGRKETLFLILFALFAGFAVRCG